MGKTLQTIALLAAFTLSNATPNTFRLLAQPYNSPCMFQAANQPAYLTDSGKLTISPTLATTFTIKTKTSDPDSSSLISYYSNAEMGIPPEDPYVPPLYHQLTSTNANITSKLSTVSTDDGEILVFENEDFNNTQREGVFLADKGAGEGGTVFVVTQFQDVDWNKMVLVDLVVEEVEDKGEPVHEDM